MERIDIKPLSVNKAYKGRKFKTKEHQLYSDMVFYLLPELEPINGKIELYIKFGYSSKGSDIDNAAKPFIDVLQKKYNFNDNLIYRLVLEKEVVPKGNEFIEFKIESYENR
jgi:Holliday junction resolvase RusA-like endonuclease